MKVKGEYKRGGFAPSLKSLSPSLHIREGDKGGGFPYWN